MQTPQIKICCIADNHEAQLAVKLGAHALGLVGPMPSGPGVINEQTAAQIVKQVPSEIQTFWLTASTNADDIARELDSVGANTVQMVNYVSPNEIKRLAKVNPKVRRVQVVHVEDRGCLELINEYSTLVDAFLLDSGKPNAPIAELGGTGRVHDWSISAEFVKMSPLPVFLAGGLRPENVQEALAKVNPFGFDICSGVRVNGKLDENRLASLVAAIHARVS